MLAMRTCLDFSPAALRALGQSWAAFTMPVKIRLFTFIKIHLISLLARGRCVFCNAPGEPERCSLLPYGDFKEINLFKFWVTRTNRIRNNLRSALQPGHMPRHHGIMIAIPLGSEFISDFALSHVHIVVSVCVGVGLDYQITRSDQHHGWNDLRHGWNDGF